MKHDLPERKVRRGTDRESWVSRYRASELSLQQFAQAQGLRPTQLHYWVYGKRSRGPGGPPLVKARLPEIAWGELLPSPAWAAEISLADGAALRVNSAAPPVWVAEVVKQLRGVC
jgi:hypothetical protein